MSVGPHAVDISDASSLSGVFGQARKSAHWGGRISVDAGDRVGLIVETGVVDGTAEIASSTAVGELAVRALELASEVDPFADSGGGTNSGVANSAASRGAGADAGIPHAITRSRVAGSFVGEAETALERACLRGIVVDASASLLFALFGRRNLGAGVVTSGLSRIPDAVRIGCASEETVEAASLVADVRCGVEAAHHIACARGACEVLGASVDTRTSVADGAEAVGQAGAEIGLRGILEVASVIADAVVEHALRTRGANKRRCDDGALLTTHEAAGIPEAETERIGFAVLLIVVLDAAAANAGDVGGSGRNEAHGFGVANIGAEVAAVGLANLDGRIPHGVVERIGHAVSHGGVTNFGNDDAAENTDGDVTEDATAIQRAFVQRAIRAAVNADATRSIPDAIGFDLALTAEESGVASLGADFVGRVPEAATGEIRTVADIRGVGSGAAGSLADAVGRDPGADSGIHVAFGVFFHVAAVLDANRLNGIPQAARVAVAARAVGVRKLAAADASVVVPFAESVLRALIFAGAIVARSSAVIDGPVTLGSGIASKL